MEIKCPPNTTLKFFQVLFHNVFFNLVVNLKVEDP
jgi:hypothetical protein